MPLFDYLFGTDRFVPRRTCGGWYNWEIVLHNVSDLFIWMAYLAIPFALLHLTRRRPQIGFSFVFYCFVAFIVSCGFTHFMEFLMFYWPIYAAAGVLKAITAVVSWSTVIVLWRVMPLLVTVKTPTELERVIHHRTLELAEANRLLKQHQTHLQIVMDHAPLLISYVDLQFRYKLASKTYEQWFGKTVDQIIGRTIRDVIGDDAWFVLEPKLLNCLETGEQCSYEALVNYTYSGRKWIYASYTPYLGADGTVEGVVVVVKDITQKKDAEIAQRRATETMEHLIQYSPVGTLLLDSEDRIILANRPLSLMNGYSVEEMEGMKLADVVPDLWPTLKETVEAVRETGHTLIDVPREGETKNQPGVKRFWVENLFPVPNGGEKPNVGIMVREITEERLLKQELQKRLTDLAEANQRKDEFLAILGHELRNPLAAVKNAADLLTLESVSQHVRNQSGEILNRSMEHILRLVDDIITVSRAVRGKIDIKHEDVLICDVIERAVQVTEPLFDARRHKLSTVLCDPPVYITGDKIRLVQVVSNLLTNAAKYTHDGGRISLECRQHDERMVEILVTDNGIGIPPDVMPHIYELCVRGIKATQKDHGLGIGLTMVKTIVDLHGGTVTATSEGPDKGSQFLVRLPYTKVQKS